MRKEEIIEAYIFLRENNQSLPSETLEFIRDVSLRELEKVKDGRECSSCIKDGKQGIYPGPCTGCGDGELKNFKIKL